MAKCYAITRSEALVGCTYVTGFTAAVRTYANSPRSWHLSNL
jgi:hypothetical protein